MEISVRPPRKEDILQTNAIFYKTWLATYPNSELGITVDDIHDRFKESNTPAVLEKRARMLEEFARDGLFFVAEADSRLVGLCRITLHPDKNQLQAIYVLPEYQGKGVGKALWAEARKCFDPSKESIVHVATYNAKAQAFYKSLGFKETGKSFTEERLRMKSGALIPETEFVLPAERV